jgi:hypothetical protein
MLTGEHERAVETLGAVLAVDSVNPIASISLALAPRFDDVLTRVGLRR